VRSIVKPGSERQSLVVDFDKPQRVFGDLLRFGGNRGDLVADEAYGTVEQETVLVPGNVWPVLTTENRMHAGEGTGPSGVHAHDACVR
jgi:hypothetical protein